ncbi:DNA alkylation repair protein, partial [Clostridium perfringens]
MYTVAVSYLPLHDKAVETAKAVGPVEMKRGDKSKILSASENIRKEVERGKLGFKRKYGRC